MVYTPDLRSMSAPLIDGHAIAQAIHKKTKEKVEALKTQGITPKLAVLLVGNDKPSHTYVRKKQETAEEVGITFERVEMKEESTTEDIISKIKTLQSSHTLSGLIVQLPLPKHIDTQNVLDVIDPAIDVDCLTPQNLGKLMMNRATIIPPTPGAVMSILEHLNVAITGKNVTIVGVGPLVGKPLAIMMMNARASVTTCNSATRDMKEKCLAADMLVSGIGKKYVIKKDMVKTGAIVIDTGVDFDDDVMYGDVDVEGVKDIAYAVTPTPGGVGPITVAKLLLNTVLCAEKFAS